jgi:steroid delta-isomerase-like uncharacterized protein
MSEAANAATVRRQFDAWNARDASAIVRDVTDGFLLESDTNQSPVVGRDGLRQYANALFLAFPDLLFDIRDVVGEGDVVAVTWLASGTHRAEFLGMRPSGRRAQLHGCTISHFRGGKIARQESYWDVATLTRQLRGAATVSQPLERERPLREARGGR